MSRPRLSPVRSSNCHVSAGSANGFRLRVSSTAFSGSPGTTGPDWPAAGGEEQIASSTAETRSPKSAPARVEPRIHHDENEPVPRRLVQRGAACTRENSAQYLDEERERKPLVPSHREDRPAAIELSGVGGRIPLGVQDPSRGQLTTLVEEDPHLALGDDGRREVGNYRPPPGRGNCVGHRVGAEPGLASSEGDDIAARVAAVAPCERDQSLVGYLLDPFAQPADMADIRQQCQTDARAASRARLRSRRGFARLPGRSRAVRRARRRRRRQP